MKLKATCNNSDDTFEFRMKNRPKILRETVITKHMFNKSKPSHDDKFLILKATVNEFEC